MAKKLYVGNLSYKTTEESLKEYFAQAGSITSAFIVSDKFTGRPKGFGFVEFENDADADKAIEMFNAKEFEGRNLNVSEAKPQTDRPPRRDFGDRGPRRDFRNDGDM
jgi:RNA recognition motif-containing protein